MKWRNSFSKPFLAVPSIHTPAPAIFFGFCLAWYSMTRGSTCLSVPTKLDARECHGDTKTETPKKVSIKKDQEKHKPKTSKQMSYFDSFLLDQWFMAKQKRTLRGPKETNPSFPIIISHPSYMGLSDRSLRIKWFMISLHHVPIYKRTTKKGLYYTDTIVYPIFRARNLARKIQSLTRWLRFPARSFRLSPRLPAYVKVSRNTQIIWLFIIHHINYRIFIMLAPD